MGEATCGVLKVAFARNDAEARAIGNDWSQAVLANNLRSPKLANEVLNMTKDHKRTSQQRILALRIGAHCGNVSIQNT